MNYQYSPRPAQENILSYRQGRMGVSAVPGSGKTWTLSLLAAEIIKEGLLTSNQEVLIVTLVNSAVNNFSIRISSILDTFKLVRGVWEAKDTEDDLEKEIKNKFEKGYPKDNILFQAPNRAIIWQDDKEIFNKDITNPLNLIEALKIFFEYT